MPLCPHIENNQLISIANESTGFYIRATLAFNCLITLIKKISLQNFKPPFQAIIRVFDLECHG